MGSEQIACFEISLDADDLCKDVAWFTKKRDASSTELFSFDDFNIRRDLTQLY